MNEKLKRSFDVIEASPDSTYKEAKSAYKLMVQVWHPDKHFPLSVYKVLATEDSLENLIVTSTSSSNLELGLVSISSRKSFLCHLRTFRTSKAVAPSLTLQKK